MDSNITLPTRITLTLHGRTYTADGLEWDIDKDSLIDEFKGLMVAAGFSPSVLSNEFGEWRWYEDDEGPGR